MKDQNFKAQPTSHIIKKRKHPFIGETICFIASMLMLARLVDGVKSALIQPDFAAIFQTAIFLSLTVLGIFMTGLFSYHRYKQIGRVRREIKIYEKILVLDPSSESQDSSSKG